MASKRRMERPALNNCSQYLCANVDHHESVVEMSYIEKLKCGDGCFDF